MIWDSAVRAAMEAQGRSVSGVARDLGISNQKLHNALNGNEGRRLQPDDYVALAELLGQIDRWVIQALRAAGHRRLAAYVQELARGR